MWSRRVISAVKFTLSEADSELMRPMLGRSVVAKIHSITDDPIVATLGYGGKQWRLTLNNWQG